MAGSATVAAVNASSGACCFTRGSFNTSWWVVAAPMTRSPPSLDTPRISAIRPQSTSTVANAGFSLVSDFFATTQAEFDRVTGLNLRGSYFLAQAAARQMRAQGRGGRVLLLSSVCGHLAIRSMAAYSMSKAGLEMLARALVPELSPHRITINTVAPGATLTPRNLDADPHYDETWGGTIPLGRPASVEDIASAALFLLSPAASHITGQSLVVDGGWTSVGAAPPGPS